MKSLYKDAAMRELNFEADTAGCSAECVQNLILARAYELYAKRDGRPGNELEDWLAAEREVMHHLGG